MTIAPTAVLEFLRQGVPDDPDHERILDAALSAFMDFGLIGAVPEYGGEEFGVENGAQDTMVADAKAPTPLRSRLGSGIERH